MKVIVDEYDIMSKAIRNGLSVAVRRYFKNRDVTSITERALEEDVVLAEWTEYIMSVVEEYIEFEEEEYAGSE